MLGRSLFHPKITFAITWALENDDVFASSSRAAVDRSVEGSLGMSLDEHWLRFQRTCSSVNQTCLMTTQTSWATLTAGVFDDQTDMIIIIMYIYHALINALNAHMIHINLNMIFYTHVEHSPTKTIYIKYYAFMIVKRRYTTEAALCLPLKVLRRCLLQGSSLFRCTSSV